MREILPSSSSSVTLVRSDSGVDVISVGGITNTSYQDWDAFESIRNQEIADPSQNCCKNWLRRVWPLNEVFARWVTWVCVLAASFGGLWAILPNEMVPGKSLFGLTITILFCVAAELVAVRIPTPKGLPPFPPLLASLLMGLALRNIPNINVAADIHPETSAIFREIALTIILTRAGLEIEPEAMKKAVGSIVRLAFLPCIAETATIGLLAHFILGFPFEWSFMAGFMISAVSPAVVIPSLIPLQDDGWGVEKGVPSLVMAASGIDDVLAIAGFTVLLGIAIPAGIEDEIVNYLANVWFPSTFNSDQATLGELPTSSLETTSDIDFSTISAPSSLPPTKIGKEIGGAIVEIIIGIVSGLVLGFFLSIIPTSRMKHKTFCRAFLLLSIGILFVFGSTVWGIPGSGSLCALIMSFTASMRWKDDKKPLAEIWHHMWSLFQPILFGLTGSLVDVALLDGTTVGLGLAVMGTALVVRLITSTLVTFGVNFNIKERLFVSIAWIPKGTVQAALGSAALDQVRATCGSEEELRWGEQILVMAVLITLITAPIGGFGISVSGPRLLQASPQNRENNYVNQGYISEENHSRMNGGARRGSADSRTGLTLDPCERRFSHCSGIELRIKDLPLDDIKEEDEVNVGNKDN